MAQKQENMKMPDADVVGKNCVQQVVYPLTLGGTVVINYCNANIQCDQLLHTVAGVLIK